MRLSKEALKKYADGTTYRAGGKTYKRVSYAGTKRGDNYCARSSGQKQTEKVKVRRKAWGCKGKKSIAGIGNPCWSGYKQFGMKTKAGRSVPNCVKITGLGAVENTAGWGNDPNKPKEIEKVEQKVFKWYDSLKKGWTPTTQYSPVLARLRNEWEQVTEKYEDEWKPKYNFGDLLA